MKKKSVLFLLALPVAGAVVILMKPKFIRFVEEARLSEVRVNLTSISVFMRNYHSELKEYPNTFQKMGFIPEGSSRSEYFLNADQLPSRYRTVLEPENLPFVEKDSYRIVASFRSNRKILFFAMTELEDIRPLPVEIEMQN